MAKNEMLRESISEIESLQDAIILDNPYFDNSIVGYTEDGKLVYDFDKMVDEFFQDNKDDNIEYVNAIEFIEYNTLRAIPYAGERAPIIIFKDGLGI